MPVNTAALKTFAPAMRRQLLEAVGRKLDRLLNSQTPDTLSTQAKQIAELLEQEAHNREQLLERVAYTWFNRLCALRYLDARGWHPFGCKVLMPAGEGETQPELLKLMRAGNLPSALQSHTDQDRLHGLLDGQVQTAIAGADPQGEVYRLLVLAVCRCYHELLPNLFEGLDDASELLLPDDLLSDGSIVGAFRKEINDDDCQDVESLGWLYQFYIAEKKDEVMARKKAVPTEDIPAVTQLFTPHWIVRYLVENSLGRLWLLNRQGSNLREQMPYYIEGEAETDFLEITKPEEIKLLDPACGSGHMLTYAFDLLVLIYEEEGYSPNEIPGLILKHNLHGLEICPRAAQLAELALVFKAREQSRRFFQPEHLVRPQIIELQDVQFKEGELNDYIEALHLGELFDPNLFKLLHQFEEAKNFGSLIQPCLDERTIADLRRAIEAKELSGQLFLRETHLKVLRVLEQAEALTQRYQVVVANPPYMGSKNQTAKLKAFLEHNFEPFKADLFSAFFVRSRTLALPAGFLGFMSPFVWMFIGSYENLRRELIEQASITSLVQLEYSGFDGATVPICCFTLNNQCRPNHKGAFIRLSAFRGAENQAPRTLEAIRNQKCGWFYSAATEEFKKLPGWPIAYWLTSRTRDCFATNAPLESICSIREGINTGDNARFLRYWSEVGLSKISFNTQAAGVVEQKWVPHKKGGYFRRWYGNAEFVLNWEGNGVNIHAFHDLPLAYNGAPMRGKAHFFKESLSWSRISSGSFAIRYYPYGFSYDSTAPSIFTSPEYTVYVLGFLNSEVVSCLLAALSPTLDFRLTNIGNLPLALKTGDTGSRDSVSKVVSDCMALSRADWDNFETSWDFRDQPLLRPGLNGQTLESSWLSWEAQSAAAIRRMQELETENNRLFIQAYGLEGELQAEVPEDQITLARADQRKDIAAFLSYATGCMMGRYSLDQPGLILANAGDTLENYVAKVGKSTGDLIFQPDRDGIIPVLDDEWFEDDIVARTREFLEVTFPESTVTENLRFIEESLGKDIRKYFCSEFYKDHLQTYKKRPIYWLLQSPKKGFSCLIYLHRYTKDTLNQVLNNYFRPYLQKLEARLAQLGLDQLNDALPTRERTAARKEAEKITKVLKECQAWEQDALLPLAQQRIELDLDDGVKVNYLKLQDVLALIPGLAAKED
jgi:type II restriction/modification system DNA methylase subunit YeeA